MGKILVLLMATRKEFEDWYTELYVYSFEEVVLERIDKEPFVINSWLSYCKSKGIKPEIEVE